MANQVKVRDYLRLVAASLLPAAKPGPGVLSGTWLLVAPERKRFRDLCAQCARAMGARGAHVDSLLVDCAAMNREVLAGLLEGALAGAPLAGVVSLLALDETPLPGLPATSPALTGTRGLIQALADAEVGAPLWMFTGGVRSWGLGRVLGPEHPDGWGGLVDLVDVPAEFDDRAVALLCHVLAGYREDQAAIGSSAPRPWAAAG
ncbi:MAG TPA: hypothetical protein VIZ43_18180 [Trebonia sp.]